VFLTWNYERKRDERIGEIKNAIKKKKKKKVNKNGGEIIIKYKI
jgi:hypothetical protein